MATAAVDRRAGRGHLAASHDTYAFARSPTVGSAARPSLSISTFSRYNSALSDDLHASPTNASVPRPSTRPPNSRSQLRNVDTSMSSYSLANTPPAAPRATPGHSKLHKRAGSGSSLPGPPSPYQGAYSHYATPFATREEPLPDLAAPLPANSAGKTKPYMRKKSIADEEQGRLDLSKSVKEQGHLAGLGIDALAARPAAEVNFTHASRRGTHDRTTSVGSQASTGSGSFRPGQQPFVHPMKQNPRPYTPATGSSNASLAGDPEEDESDDVVDDDFRLGPGFRTRRSVSMSSTPVVAPTPLSQSHTAHDFGMVPELASTSQTNLSIKSTRSAKSSKSRPSRPRRDTDRSAEFATTPSSRTSADHAFSFVSRRSDPDPASRDERIRAARRKFEEKEAQKDRKAEKEALKKRETEETKAAKKQDKHRPTRKPRRRDDSSSPEYRGERSDEGTSVTIGSRSYEQHRPGEPVPRMPDVRGTGTSEKTPRAQERKAASPQSGWIRFSAWIQTRMLGCAGKR